jgi:hypothetical protein
MARFEQIRDRFPTLYRPEKGDTGLLTRFLQSVADVLQDIHLETSDVLQSHWFSYADRAMYNNYFIRSRQLQDLPSPAVNDPVLLEFPYVHDLARLAALLALPSWQEPPALRELVEEYRLRIERIVALYRNGLGTVDALQRMVEAQLPVDTQASPETRDRPFWIEEFAPLVKDTLAVQARGDPQAMVGPLMRWTATNDGLESTSPTIYIQGVEPQESLVDATENPLIELYEAGGTMLRLGLAYRGVIAPGETLRLRPAFVSWLGLDSGIQRAEALPTENGPADPTAAGPWQSLAEAPSASTTAILQSHDRMLWIATNTDAVGTLWRYDGKSWTRVLDGLPQVHCLAENGHDLLVGTAEGLLHMPLYLEGAGPVTATAVSGLETEVYTLFLAADGTWWLGTDTGIFQLFQKRGGDDTNEYSVKWFVLGADEAAATKVYAISQDKTDAFYFGTDLGLFQYQPGTGDWYWYAGEEHTEQAKDWQIFVPEKEEGKRNFPTEEQVFLPAVRCVYRGPDASLWIGTDNGIARYVARSGRGLVYETVLEAFPDLTTGRVFAIKEDARGLVWFCTDRGLFRYDGRDWWQFQASTWVQLGCADTLYETTPESRGTWRFRRASSQWQRFNIQASDWIDYLGEPRTAASAAVRTMLWTDQVVGDLGEWDGTNFSNPTEADATRLVVRYKPSETRIVDGGIPAIPCLPAGSSIWRYLSLEPKGFEIPEDLPAWTIEGRLLPAGEIRPFRPIDGRLLKPFRYTIVAPGPGRYDMKEPPPVSDFDESVFAFNPSARVWLEWEARRPATVLVRLKKRSADEHLDPAIVDRVWKGIEQVRPAGVRAMLAFEEDMVGG